MAGDVALDGALTRLVPTTENDLELLASWFSDSDFVEHWGGAPLSRQEVAEKYVGRRRPQVESFLVLAQGAAVGYAQYWHADATEGGIDIVLTSGARGRGLGPDAAHALVTYLCSERGWRRVTVDPEASDLRAVHAWEKAGFHHVAREGRNLLMEWRPEERLWVREHIKWARARVVTSVVQRSARHPNPRSGGVHNI